MPELNIESEVKIEYTNPMLERRQEITVPIYEPEVKIEYTNLTLERRQEITIPIYESEDEPEPEILHNLPISQKRVKNQNIVRKVSLNPLSDA